MTSLAAILLPLLLAVPALADEEVRVEQDIAYSDAGGEGGSTRLDVYAPADGEDHPVVLWVHGGAWRIGDKAHLQRKPEAFTSRGYVLVSVNYRLLPGVTYREQAGDLAAAIRWIGEHAGDHGGSPDRIALIGHSAGAHLAALVATDHRYLEAEGLDLGALSGVVLLDGAGYDIPRQVREARVPRMKDLYEGVFTEDEETQRDASPITHIAEGKGIPPFLILHVAGRRDSQAQSEGLAARLVDAGVEAKVIPAQGKTHATINRELGIPGDEPTSVVFGFLGAHRSSGR
ncbi:alpha/beta hydrolase [Tautonia plasticadhaerens]|uniref:Carboxylesterase NlhH n=1 Tax=Tautonia plasticadhaerens TaxID=2527974 RepID=A0A518H426_9BACT|nr:alpha/beta hydrolase [Tautonia plasticadhaerens]QDV35611.1 Carboxylesterase NlhH [Tautonia plasticadhaerens]